MPNFNIIITQEMEYILSIRLANFKKLIIRICKRTNHSQTAGGSGYGLGCVNSTMAVSIETTNADTLWSTNSTSRNLSYKNICSYVQTCMYKGCLMNWKTK